MSVPSPNLVMCFDGTWNRADAPHPTNVAMTRSAAAAPERFVPAHVYYDEGVGTGRFDRLRGGVVGLGLARNVEEAFRWLIKHYRAGLELYLFGYSRGAYTARSLAGMVGLLGVPPQRDLAPALARAAMGVYRRRRAEEVAEWDRMMYPVPARVRFMGVWDTVGSLGVPIDGLRWVGARRWRWHDVGLGAHIHHACHAVAIDEQRRSFAPSLWAGGQHADQVVEQVWFPGVHGDVGGGQDDTGLSDRALTWMWRRARSAGLDVAELKRDLRPVWDCRPGDSMTAPYRLLGRHQRTPGDEAVIGEAIHKSAVELLALSAVYRGGAGGRAVRAALDRGLPIVA